MSALILPSQRVVQPNQAVDFSSSFPKPNAAFLGSIKRRDIATGTTYSLVTGEDTTTATISGVASRLFRGTALCTPASASGLDAALIMFRLPTAAITSRLFFGGDESANLGAGFDVSAGVLRFLATQSSTAYVNATTPLSDGQIYCAFGYTTGILPSQRFIFVDGINVSGAAATNSRADKGIIRSNFGPSGGSPLPADILMAAVWKGARFNDEQARALSTNPWQLFKPVERRIWVPASTGGSVGNASGSLSSITTSAASAGASGAAQSAAACASLSVTQAEASASGGVSVVGNAPASLASLSLSAASASASGSAAASAALAGISVAPASAVASGGASVPATASASLASLGTAPATATASGAATAAGAMLGMNLTPAQAQAIAAAWAAAELRALSVTPATATAGDGSAAPWPTSRADPQHLAVVPFAGVRAMVPVADLRAAVPLTGVRAIVQQDTP